MGNVKMVTEAGERGVRYEVLVGETIVWTRFVPFGSDAAHRAGGPAFRDAAHEQERVAARQHTHRYDFDRHCGARVCVECNDHAGLARCFCGWARDGGDGRAQLIEMGERIDPEDP